VGYCRFDRTFLNIFERLWNKTNKERFWLTESIAEMTWFKTPDKQWEAFALMQRKTPMEKHYMYLKENKLPFILRLYAIAGALRRAFVKKYIKRN